MVDANGTTGYDTHLCQDFYKRSKNGMVLVGFGLVLCYRLLQSEWSYCWWKDRNCWTYSYIHCSHVSLAGYIVSITYGKMMFFKSVALPEQFRLASIVTLTQYYNNNQSFPNHYDIESRIKQALSSAGLKISRQQEATLKAYALIVLMSEEIQDYLIQLTVEKNDSKIDKIFDDLTESLLRKGIAFV